MNQFPAGVIPFSEPQLEAIISILLKQCSLIVAREATDRKDYPELYDELYMKGRKHSYTAAVLAGFQESTSIPGMRIKKQKYGRIHWQPEIIGESVILQIYSSEASLKTREIREKCTQYNVAGSPIEYCILQFFLNRKGRLSKVDLVKLNKEARIISRVPVYSYLRSLSYVA